MADLDYPDNLLYTPDHEWVRLSGDRARVGITAYAQDALGDIVYVTLPDDGATVQAGNPCGEVESTKSVSDLVAPLTGPIVALNEALDAEPELVNTDPYGAGWMFEIALPDATAVTGLLTAQEYRETLG